MEDDEETKNPYEPFPREVGSSNMEEKPLETVEVTNTEQCEFVPESLPELGDSQLLGSESAVEAKDDEAVAEEEMYTVDTGMQRETEGVSVPEVDDSPLVGAKSPIVREEVDVSTAGTAVETKAEAEMVECSLGKSVTELDDSLLVGDMPAIEAEDVEAVVVEEIPTAGMEMDMKAEVEQVESGLGKSIPELDDSQLAGTNSPSAAKDGEAVGVGEISTVGTEMEIKCEAEAVEGGSVSGFDDSQLVGVNSPILDELVAKEEIPRAGTEMEMENEVERIQSVGEEFVSELDDSQLLGVESSIAAKEDEDNESMAEDTGMEDAEMETETESANEVETKTAPYLDDQHNVGAQSPIVARDDEDDDDEDVAAAEEETPTADTEMETETDVAEMAEAEKGVGGGGKRKRGRISRVPAKAPARKVTEEDVCFICFDGGDLVLCDRRGCPKAYHPSCVNRDEAFFRSKGRWNCGWHLCSICQKNAHYMCYTCTFSLCKACIKDAGILCVRGNKGFCETCMRTVMLIENNEQANKEDQVDFDDKSSWEYLFKDYWIDLKAKLSLSSVELAQAKNPWKGFDALVGKQESPEELYDAINDQVSGSDNTETLEGSKHKKRKVKKRSKSLSKEEDLPRSTAAIGAEGTSIPGNTEWASKELLEFVVHMKNGDKSVLSQFDVQALLLEYIKSNKLRDPRRKSQIICDARLENLFGKARVGHFEMLKLLESHFLIKEDSQTDDIQGTVVDTEVNKVEADGTIDAPIKGSKDRSRKMRKKGYERGPQSNVDDYAAIDTHNINLIYLRRKLVEDLLEDIEKFHDKVVGTFVRIRISGSNQKQDMYRLVQVVGTRKADEPYKVGKKTTDLVLEILNLNKTEVVSIDTISNQEFTEDECKRLRQSIKCGLINRLTVGDILEKAMEVQAARVNDWLETEIVRLSHLRDRASEKGRRKELRECVEKLQHLKTPEERRRRLEEITEIHADPNMDPSYESEEDDCEMEDNKQEIHLRPRGSGFSRKVREPISPRRGSFSSTDSWSGTRKNSGKNWEINRNISNKDFPYKGEVVTLVAEIPNENAWNQGRDKDTQQSNNMEKVNSATNSETVGRNSHSFIRSESFSGAASETSQASLISGIAEAATKISETEKMWHYQDPAGKVQGPFSMVQMCKWNSTGYFPLDLRIWRTTEKQDDSILLTDALAGRFQKELPPTNTNFTKAQTVHSPHLSSSHVGKAYGASLQEERQGEGEGEGEGGERLDFDQSHRVRSPLELSSSSGWGATSVEVPKLSADSRGSDHSRNDSLNLPFPTPKSSTPGWTGGQASEIKWSSSSFPVQQAGSVLVVNSFPGGNGPSHSPAVATSDSGQLSTIHQTGSEEHSAMESLGVLGPASIMNPGRQLMRGFENDSSSSLTSSSSAPNSEQGSLVGSTTALPTSQTIVTGESYGIHPPVEAHGWGSGSVQKRGMVVSCQTAGSDSQAWGGASSLKLESNPSLPVPVQPAAYGHWVGIPSTVQNPAGHVWTPGFSTLPQPDPWRPPVAGNQSNFQPAAPPSVPQGMGVAEINAFAPGPRPDNANTGWGPMHGNPNMGWGGPAPGTTNMNWGAAVQGPVPGTVNPVWVSSTGNPGAMVQSLQPANANPGWAAQTVNPGSAMQGPPPGNGNPGWVASTGNPGANVQGSAVRNVNPVWGTPTGNPGTTVQGPAPGNANPGWGAPAGNEKQHNGDRFSGQRDRGSRGRDSGFGGGRPWNRQSSFGSGGQRVCHFHQNGHCKKGGSCDRLHT